MSDIYNNIIWLCGHHDKKCCKYSRGKKSVAINFKNPKGIEAMKKLTQQCDVLIEPFRPGMLHYYTFVKYGSLIKLTYLKKICTVQV